MNLGRLSVRQKLSLLLLVPLIVLVFLAVPFIADRTSDVRAASGTANVTRVAREVSALVLDVQHERLLMLGYVASPPASRSALISASQDVLDRTADLRGELGSRISAGLTAALGKVDGLAAVRARVLSRTVPSREAYQAYGTAIGALLSSLGLEARADVDPAGARGVGSLDALLRANEASSQIGAALMVSIVDREAGPGLLAEASAAKRLYTERFVALAPVGNAGLFQQIDASETSKRVDELARTVRTPTADPVALAAGIVGAVDSLAGLQRLIQAGISQEITEAAAGRAQGATIAAIVTTALSVLLFGLVFGLIVAVSRSIAQPLRKLTRAATAVADLANAELVRVSADENAEGPAPRLAAIDIGSDDEIGELATAFNRVQATAALLLDRQLVTRRNVSTMFANVGRRTQNLVGRQLGLLEELERDETDPKLLAELYRLDHVCTRLRRSAYSLLVVAGAPDESYGAQPIVLANVIRAALGEIEGFQNVRLHGIADVTVTAHLVSDLTLLIAELLENATSFSPPEELVDVYARSGPDHCRLSIIDHGIGMPDSALAEENHRLLERERLDIAPTSTLGLFVVGRLARRHGLYVRLAPTPERGVSVLIDIPNSLLLGAGSVAVSARDLAAANDRGLTRDRDEHPDQHEIDEQTGHESTEEFTQPAAVDDSIPAAAIDDDSEPIERLAAKLVASNGVKLVDVGPVAEFPWFAADGEPSEQPADAAGVAEVADTAPTKAGSINVATANAGSAATAASTTSASTTSANLASVTDQPRQPTADRVPPGGRVNIPAPAGQADAPVRVERLNDPPRVEPTDRGGLQRRVPSAQLFDLGNAPPPAGRATRDPAADRAAMEALEAGAARAARELPSPARPSPVIRGGGPTGPPGPGGARPGPPRRDHAGPGKPAPVSAASTPAPRPPRPVRRAHDTPAPQLTDRGGLQRRVPGASLAATLRAAQPERAAPPSGGARHRNPEAERDSLNAFLHGFAEGTGSHSRNEPDKIPPHEVPNAKEGER